MLDFTWIIKLKRLHKNQTARIQSLRHTENKEKKQNSKIQNNINTKKKYSFKKKNQKITQPSFKTVFF